MLFLKIIKFVAAVPIYLFLLLEGFFGGKPDSKDIWDKLMKWVKR